MESIKLSLQISDIMCEGCVSNIQNSLEQLDGMEDVEVSLEHKKAEVTFNPEKIGQDQINEAIEEAGYSVDTAKKLA